MVAAELFQLRHRTSTWVLLSLWAAMGLFFGYVLPYMIETPVSRDGGPFASLMPDRMVSGVISGFPFYGGAIALMLGVLSIGTEFGWGTFKTLFTQRPGRGQVFTAKMAALAIVLIPFVVVEFAIGGTASAFIAWREDVAIVWPPVQDIVEGILAGWLILAVWAAFGVMLAVLTRGTSLAIGIGIIWALVIEGLLAAFATSISWLEWANEVMLRSNAYSLVEPLGGGSEAEGPGAFTGPYVGTGQAMTVLVGYILIGLGTSYILLRRRDVT
jgi:ABC-type transport system involved in multi-copper enzyme maturation permease subunit